MKAKNQDHNTTKRFTPKIGIKKGDEVMVISGASKGQKGTVSRVIPKTYRAVVEGLNKVKRHIKPTQANPQGQIVEFEAPIHISNLMVVDPKSKQPTRIGRKLVDGQLVRFSKKSGEILK